MKDKIIEAMEKIREAIRANHKPNQLSSDWQDAHHRLLCVVDDQELELTKGGKS